MKNHPRQSPDIQRTRLRDYAGKQSGSCCLASAPAHPGPDTSWPDPQRHKVSPHLTARHCLLVALLSLLGVADPMVSAAVGAEGPPRIASMDIGLGGKFKLGFWTPVHVTIDGGREGFTGHFEFAAPDGDDLATRFRDGATAWIEAPAGGQWRGWRYVKLGRIDGDIRGIIRDREGQIVDEQVLPHAAPLPATWHWVVTLGTDVQVEEAAVLFARMRDEKLVASTLTDPAAFPDQWYGYEGVNVLLVAAGSKTPLEVLDDAQYEALLHWLRLGGRLVLAAGRRAPEIFHEAHRFHPLRPGEFVELDEYWKASGLENFARAAERVQTDNPSPLAVYSQLRGRVACYEGAGGTDDRALIMRFPLGFGEVTYVALDLDLPPLSTWPSRARLLAKLLQTRSDEEDSAIGDESLGQMTHVGFDDMSGQLRAALDQFPGVTLVQFSWVAGLLILYILVLGPLDFFGLRKIQRFHWTWITFPLTVLLFCGVAIWLSGLWKGSRLQLNQVDVVDVDPAGQWVRGTTWASLYNPRTSTLNVDVTPIPALKTEGQRAQVLLSWLGLPGTGLGGMNTTATVDVLSDEYQVNYQMAAEPLERKRIESLPIHTASTKGLCARWEVSCEVGETGQLTTSKQEPLQGTVTNPLQVELSNAWVYFENWAYPLEGRLAPGETVRLGKAPPFDLSWQLQDRRVIGSHDEGSQWSRDDLSNTPRIVELLMFYSAAGGRAYTRLSHGFQGYVDLSRHLRDGKAILVGRSKLPASRLTIENNGAGQPAVETTPAATGGKHPDQHWTFYRILLPVTVANDVEEPLAASRP